MKIVVRFLLAFAVIASVFSTQAQLFVRRSDQILKIDPATGVQTPFFNHPTNEFIGDIVADGTNRLLAVVWNGDFTGPDPFFSWRILSINASNAQATLIYADNLLHTAVPSITPVVNGFIYAGGADTVLKINPATGAANDAYREPLLDGIWGITAEPAGTLLFASDFSLFRLDAATAQATNIPAFESDVTWINSWASDTNGAIYLAADNERILELNPAGDLRVVTQSGYFGSADNGLFTRDSAAVGLAWLNETQLIATVSQTVRPNGSLIPSQAESRVIWVDIVTGEQHLISEGGLLAQSLGGGSTFSGLAMLGAVPPRTASPPLAIAHNTDPDFPLALEWSGPNFVLQTTTNVADTNAWTTIPDAPIVYAGYASYSIALTNRLEFFRLIYQP